MPESLSSAIQIYFIEAFLSKKKQLIFHEVSAKYDIFIKKPPENFTIFHAKYIETY